MGALTGKTEPDGLSVTAVIVTFNRREVVLQCLGRLLGANVPPDQVVVVDNASSDGTSVAIRAAFPQVIVLEAEENLGPAGGFHKGMAEAARLDGDWIMVLNDDCFVDHGTLEGLVKVAASAESSVGIIAPAGGGGDKTGLGNMWKHRLVPVTASVQSHPGPPVDVDQVTFNGALIRADLVRRLGLPRLDYFIMWEEVEYCLRFRQQGFRVLAVPGVYVQHDHVGWTIPASNPWREYYQTRNHLRFVLERRSVIEGLHWLMRQVRLLSIALLFGDRKVAQIRLRLLGAVDAIRGRMGRTVTPRRVELPR